MKIFLNTIFCEFYSWQQKIWGVGHGATRAICSISLLIFFNLFSIYIFASVFSNNLIPILLSNIGMIVYLVTIALIFFFLLIYFRNSRHLSWCKKHSAIKLLGFSKKQLAVWYIILTLFIWLFSAYTIYLRYSHLKQRFEMFNLKRINFRDEVLQHFQFLISDFGYEEPLYSRLQYSDTFRYSNKTVDRYIEVSNSYHPYDYGFEIDVGTLSTSQIESPKLLLYKLKEDQNISQDYIIDLAGNIL